MIKKEEKKEFTFSIFSEYAKIGIITSLKELLCETKPVICCIGSDLVLGDSLGPLVGTILEKKGVDAFVYGTLTNPITAKEADYVQDYLKTIHNNRVIIAVDAAVGAENDVGLIKVIERGIKPGLGVNKNLKKIGDVGIMGIVANKDNKGTFLRLTRLNLIYKFAEIIADSIEAFLLECNKIKTENLILNNNLNLFYNR